MIVFGHLLQLLLAGAVIYGGWFCWKLEQADRRTHAARVEAGLE